MVYLLYSLKILKFSLIIRNRSEVTFFFCCRMPPGATQLHTLAAFIVWSGAHQRKPARRARVLLAALPGGGFRQPLTPQRSLVAGRFSFDLLQWATLLQPGT